MPRPRRAPGPGDHDQPPGKGRPGSNQVKGCPSASSNASRAEQLPDVVRLRALRPPIASAAGHFSPRTSVSDVVRAFWGATFATVTAARTAAESPTRGVGERDLQRPGLRPR